MEEKYESIKQQLNANIFKLASDNKRVLMEDDKKDEDIIKLITKDETFVNEIKSAKNILVVNSDDDLDFVFRNKKDALDTLVYVVAISRGLADPYYVKEELNNEEEKIYYEKGEAYGNVYVQIGKKCVTILEEEIKNEINRVLKRCGMPKTWFSFIAASLLGYNYLNFHISVESEHAERVKVVNVEREYIDLRIYKGINKKEYCDIWKVIEDYLTHNIPAGLIRVINEGTRLYNESVNGVKTSDIQKKYQQQHPCSDELTTRRNALKLLKRYRDYNNIRPY